MLCRGKTRSSTRRIGLSSDGVRSMAEPVTATATETMAHFPLMIELADRAVVVIGGGQVAARKVSTIVEYGAAVTVIAPELHPDLLALVQAGRISHRSRPYQE